LVGGKRWGEKEKKEKGGKKDNKREDVG